MNRGSAMITGGLLLNAAAIMYVGLLFTGKNAYRPEVLIAALATLFLTMLGLFYLFRADS